MRRIRIFHSGDLSEGLSVILNPNASHHLLQVLRKKMGEQFWIFNGNGGEFEAKLISDNKKNACVEIGAFYPRTIDSSLQIHLGQGISRGERMDFAIQKAVELGITEITPLFTAFCQVQLSEGRVEKRVAHWQSIAISAAEQSGRCTVPTIHFPLSFSEWIKGDNEIKLICCPRADKTNKIISDNATPKNISIAIGPEGGFSDEEIQMAMESRFEIFSLGPRILRTETATVVAITLLQEKWGDLSNY